MTPAERHARAVDLFLDALERPDDTRTAWLHDATGGDDGLRTEVEGLLRAHAAQEAFLDEPVLARAAEPNPEGKLVGPWRLQDRLGVGGMGVVYRADRADGLYERTVALKLLAPDALLSSGEPLARRLAAERQILARLEHEGIARLYDGGVTDDGLPYLALELVDGAPITDYAAQHGLSASARAALFARACDAVAYAHRNLVVHRDLKPDHIQIVEGDGRASVKLLDFGVSALLGDPTGNGLTLPTVSRALTPSYAAPEQVRGEPVTTASDIYALGVVLYELLAGQRPYDLSGQTAAGIERTITEVEPPLPSAVAPPEHARALRGDLDTIVMKALAKEPDRRYASAEALADDLRRHLAGHPVQARPATAGYRASRFIRRHRWGVGVATSFVLLAVTLVGVYTARLAAERDRTAEALATAEGTLDFLSETILAGDPQQGDFDAPLSAVLDSAAARVDDVEDPAVRAAVHEALAGVYLGRGLPDRAEHHARRALALFGSDSPPARIATTLVHLAQALADRGDFEAALPHHEQSIRLLRELENVQFELGVALNTYGTTLYELARMEEAEAAYREAIAVHRSQADAASSHAESTTLNNLAVMLGQQGRNQEAAAVLGQIVATLRPRTDAEAAYSLPFALNNWAATLSGLGRLDSALVLRHEALARYEAVLGPEHPETTFARTSLTFDLHKAGQLDEARREAEAVLAVAEATLPSDHPYTGYVHNVAGTTLCDTGSLERGARLLRSSLALRRTMVPEGHWILGNGESLLGGCVARLGRNEEAEALLQSGYAVLLESLGPEHERTQDARARLDALYEATGRATESTAPVP